MFVSFIQSVVLKRKKKYSLYFKISVVLRLFYIDHENIINKWNGVVILKILTLILILHWKIRMTILMEKTGQYNNKLNNRHQK